MKKLLLTLLILSASQFTNAQVTADFSFSGTECRDSLITFTNTSTGASNYDWDFGDFTNSNLQDPTRAYTGSKTYEVTLIADDGLNYDTIVKHIYIDDKAIVNFSLNHFDGIYCMGSAVTITNSSRNFSSVVWDFDDGNGATTYYTKHSWPAGAATYNVKLVGYNGCGNDSITKVLEFKNDPAEKPVASMGAFNPFYCPAEPVLIRTFGNDFDSVYFDFGDGNGDVGPSTTHAYTSAGTYDVTMYAFNECGSDTIISALEVSTSQMQSVNVFTNPATICPGEPVVISTNFNISQIAVDFGDGTSDTISGSNVEHTYATAGSYVIILTAFNDCGISDTASKVYSVVNNLTPTALFVASPSFACPNAAISFDPFDNGIVYYWDMDDGNAFVDSSGDAILYSFANTGTYNVKLIVENGCGVKDSITKVVTITNTLVSNAGFTFGFTTSGFCAGEAIEFVSGNSGTHFWDFGDGNTSTDTMPTHVFSGVGNFVVSHTLTNLCGNSDTHADVVKFSSSKNPSNFFSVTPQDPCLGDSVFLNAFFATASTMMSYDFGNGDSLNPASKLDSYIYPNSGTYEIEYTATNGCGSNNSVKQIKVLDSPSADFSYSPTNPKSGQAITFTNSSTGAASYIWTFDSEGNSVNEEPSFTFDADGSYSVTLEAIGANGCSNFTSTMITVGDFTSVSELQKGVSIYPNPASDYLTVALSNAAKQEVIIYNMIGEQIDALLLGLGETSVTYDVSGLSNGVYLMKVGKDSDQKSLRFVVLK